MSNPSIFYRFSILLLLLFASQRICSQNFQPITPQNISSVVDDIYNYYGNQIQIQPSDMISFLSSLQANYAENIEMPTPSIIARNATSLTFALGGDPTMETMVGALNTANNASEINQTSDDDYTFNDLNHNDLYLFAFAKTGGEKEGEIIVYVTTVDYIIIVDKKIMFNGCSQQYAVGSGTNNAIISLLPNERPFFMFTVRSCSAPNSIIDIFYLMLENDGNGIQANFRQNWPNNSDNSIITLQNETILSAPQSLQFKFRSFLNGNQLNQFDLRQISLTGPCVQIQVSRCGVDNRFQPNSQASLSIHPNPVRSIVQIDLSEQKVFPSEIILTNSIGKMVRSIRMKETDSLTQVLDMSDLSDDVYFISIIQDGNVSTHKVIKMAQD